MTTDSKKPYAFGLHIERLQHYGTEYVRAVICRRDPEHEHPLGVSNLSEFDSQMPKHLKRFALDGLGMYGFISDSSDLAYIGFEPEFRDVFAMHLPKLEAMARTLKRVVTHERKVEAYEPGDRFMSLAKSLKLSFAVERLSPRGDRNHSWRWMSVEEGRNRFRDMIDQAREATAVRKGMKAAS